MPARKIAVLFACIAAAAFGQGARYVIAGVTVEHATNKPVVRVLMTIMATDGSHKQKACITDANGTFRFDDVPAGKYRLNAERPGGRPQPFQASDNFVTGIAVGPGRDSEHIIFELEAGAKISGTVADDDGEPGRQARVYLLRKGVFDGSAEIHLRATANTNAAGRFHFGHLPAGTYFVAVSAQPWYSLLSLPIRGGSVPPELDVAYPITYYPGALNPASASPIVVSEGDSANIQIALHAVPAAHITLDEPSLPKRGFSANFTASGAGGAVIDASARVVYMGSATSHAEVTGLAPGDYTMTLRTFDGGRMNIIGRKLISVQRGSDPQIKDEPLASVAGKVTFIPPDRPPETGIVLVTAAGGRRGSTSEIGQDGTFRFDSGNTPAGSHRIYLTRAPQFRITQILAKGADYSAGILQIAPGADAQLSVVASRAEEQVDGIATRDGKPFSGAMILLLPVDAKADQYVGRDQSDSDGTFSITSVPAGRYVLLAIDDGRDLAYRDPAVIGPYRSGGQAISVPAASGSKLEVNVLTRRK
jgi:hypothetical protein